MPSLAALGECQLLHAFQGSGEIQNVHPQQSQAQHVGRATGTRPAQEADKVGVGCERQHRHEMCDYSG